jgi:hypothetical protein
MLFPRMLRFPDVMRLSPMQDDIHDPILQQRVLMKLTSCIRLPANSIDQAMLRVLVTVFPPRLAVAVRAAIRTDEAKFFHSLHGMKTSL